MYMHTSSQSRTAPTAYSVGTSTKPIPFGARASKMTKRESSDATIPVSNTPPSPTTGPAPHIGRDEVRGRRRDVELVDGADVGLVRQRAAVNEERRDAPAGGETERKGP